MVSEEVPNSSELLYTRSDQNLSRTTRHTPITTTTTTASGFTRGDDEDDSSDSSDSQLSNSERPSTGSKRKVLDVEKVRGLNRLRGQLEEMLSRPVNDRTRDAFHSECPPNRRLYVQSDRGSGVCTLVRAMCKAHKVNLMVIPVEIDVTFKDDMFLHILEYARLIQPCVVFFDRCDFWWSQHAYPARGEKFIMWMRTFRDLDTENIWFLYSCDSALDIQHIAFRNYISFRNIHEYKLEEEDRWKLYCDNFRRMLHKLRQTYTIVPPNIDDIIESALEEIYEVCREYAHELESFTASMILEFCQRVMESARTRGINQTELVERVEIVSVIPVYNDFTFVRHAISGTEPGAIRWSI